MSSPGPKNGIQRKRVLVIGMLDSVHFARWLKQFEQQNIDFFIMASKKYRKVNPILSSLSSSRKLATYTHVSFRRFLFVSGYLDFAIFELSRRFLGIDLRAKLLKHLLEKSQFSFVHALEMQGAGYLVSSIKSEMYSNTKVIITNWGSDIYFYKNDPAHKVLIQKTLAMADFYSAECFRDYVLAKNLGFNGAELPCIPNAGGFELEGTAGSHPIPSDRKQVLIKGYGNTFGRAEMAVKLIPELLKKYPWLNFHFYSVTEDTHQLLNGLPKDILSLLKITTVKNRLSHAEMIAEFRKSRIYIGCSVSDGISTSFLESLITGCYPIQTDTSCANEWVERGARASIIPLDSAILLREMERAILDDDLVNQAAIQNQKISTNYLSFEVLQKQALEFYG